MNCGWRHAQIVWPFLCFSLWTSRVVWFTGCLGFHRSCFFFSNRFACHIFFSPSFRFGKIHISRLLFCCDRFLRCCVHQTAKVCILQSRLRTRRCVGFWISSHPAFGFLGGYDYPGILDAIADEELVWTWENMFIAVHFDFATLVSSSFCSCIFFAIVFGQLIKLEFSAQQVELKWLMLNNWRRLFHSLRVNLLFVKMSASWCLVSMYRIWILGSKLILSNNQSKATLWVLDTFLIVGLRPLIIFLITASLSSNTYSIALEPGCVPLDGTWSTSIRSRLVCVVGTCFRMFGWVFADTFHRGSLTSLVLLVWFGEEWNASITKSQRSRAGIPSMRKPASREISSPSVEMCDTEVCFSHIQLIGTNVRLPEMHRILPDVDFESSRSPAKSESWNNPSLQCCAVFPT